MDLEKSLPEGMYMHRKYDKIMDHPIISMGENYNMVLAAKKFSFVTLNHYYIIIY